MIMNMIQRMPFQVMSQVAGMPVQPGPPQIVPATPGQVAPQAPPQGQGQSHGPQISPDMIMKIMAMFGG